MKNIICIVTLASGLLCGFEIFAIGLNEPVPAFEAIDDEGNSGNQRIIWEKDGGSILLSRRYDRRVHSPGVWLPRQNGKF